MPAVFGSISCKPLTPYVSDNPIAATPMKTQNDKSLSTLVEQALQQYFAQLDGTPPNNLHKMVISQVEQPLLHSVMQLSGGNQSRAAEILGISRATLRKKLALYDIG